MEPISTPVVFSDLDDTLFQSGRKVVGEDCLDMVPASARLGMSAPFMTVKQASLLRWLMATTQFIPVTARSVASFSELTLDFGATWRVVANGAVVIKPDGTHDEAWSKLMADEMARYQPILSDVLARGTALSSSLGIDVQGHVSEEKGMGISALFSENDGDGSRLHHIRPVFVGLEDWCLHHNGNMLAITPPSISKKRAVAYVLSKLPDLRHRPVFGFGDSLSDLGFMTDCDFITVPRGSQIGSALFS